MTLRSIWIRVLVLGVLLLGPASAAAQPAGGGEPAAGEPAAGESAAQPDVQPSASAPETEAGWLDRIRDMLDDDVIGIGVRVLFGLVLFIAGWLVSKFVAWAIYRALLRTDADNKLVERLGLKMLSDGKKGKGAPNQVERTIAKVIYYLLMMIVVIAVMQYAGLTQAAGPIEGFVSKVLAALPFIGKAALILVIAYVAGLIMSKLVTRGLDRLKLDDRFAELSKGEEDKDSKDEEELERPFSENAGRVVFWIVMVAGLAGAVDALQIAVLAAPLSNAIDRIVVLLPAVAIGIALVVVGYVLGRVARTVLDNLLDSVGLNKAVARVQLDKFFGNTRASDVVGIAAMVFIMIQASIAALNEVGLETLSQPLTGMMTQFWDLLPALAVSLLIAAAGVIGGRLLRGLVESALENLKFDKLMEKIGFGELNIDNENLRRPAQIVGLIAQVAVVLLALVQALGNLDLDRWAGYINLFLEFAVTKAGVALLIVGVGFIVGNYVRDIILSRRESEEDEGLRWVAAFCRYAVLVFGFTMAVHHLGVGENFVLISFALLFGSLCLAIALALGLGSREIAGDVVRRQYERARREIRRRTGGGPGGAGGPTGGGAEGG